MEEAKEAIDDLVIHVNNQQAQVLERLVADGQFGVSEGEVVRWGLLHFCREHPEVLGFRKAGE